MLLNDGHVFDTAAVDPWNWGKIYFFSFHEEGSPSLLIVKMGLCL